MLITNHVLSGAALGAVLDRRAASLLTGFGSHFVLDALPHFGVDNRHLMRVAVPDGLIGLTAIAVITAATPARRRGSVLLGILGACLPDLDKPGRQFFGRSPFPARFDAFHTGIQCESPRRLPVEFAVAAGLAGLLTRVLR